MVLIPVLAYWETLTLYHTGGQMGVEFQPTSLLPHLLHALFAAGPRYVTFDGIARACAIAMGKPEPEIVHFNPKVSRVKRAAMGMLLLSVRMLEMLAAC